MKKMLLLFVIVLFLSFVANRVNATVLGLDFGISKDSVKTLYKEAGISQWRTSLDRNSLTYDNPLLGLYRADIIRHSVRFDKDGLAEIMIVFYEGSKNKMLRDYVWENSYLMTEELFGQATWMTKQDICLKAVWETDSCVVILQHEVVSATALISPYEITLNILPPSTAVPKPKDTQEITLTTATKTSQSLIHLKSQAQLAAQQDVNKFGWACGGFFLGLGFTANSYFSFSEPPIPTIQGWSADSTLWYSRHYRDEARALRTNAAWVGTGIRWGAIVIGCIVWEVRKNQLLNEHSY